MTKMTRSQRTILLTLVALTAMVCGLMTSISVLNAREILQMLAPATATLTPMPPVPTETPTFPPIATASPTLTPTPTPTVTPTPIANAPPTDFDVQIAGEPENPTLRVQRGYVYVGVGAYASAIKDFDVATRMDETLAQAYVGRGAARFYLREWRAALADLDQALILNLDLADAHAWRGHLLSEWGEHALGIEALRQAVALDEHDPVKHIWLAQALLRGGNPDAAKTAYSTALSLSHSVEAYVGRMMAEAERGDLGAAQVNLSHAMSTAPFSPVSLNGRAWFFTYYQPDRLYEAEQLARQAVDGAKNDLDKARYLDTLGWILYQRDYFDKAIATLERAAALATVEDQVVYGEILEHLEEVKATQP